MLSPEQNERITRTGPETSLGKGVRRYWVPALVADQLPEAGGDPVRVTLFNEDFVLFRAGDGTLGMLDEDCRHRAASLVLGRVDDCGIRCIYHGWTFAAEGTVHETQNVAGPNLKNRSRSLPSPYAPQSVRARGYP